MKKLLNKKGFTIVELVIVIAVIAILAAVLIPTFSNVIESANKSADLSEAQNSLKAYSAYTSSKGQSLADGTVFKVKKSNRAYVFYKGSLHEFKEHDLPGTQGVILTIGSDSYKSNKMTAHYLNDAGNEKKFDTATVDGKEKYVNFFYSDTKNVTFEDGSLNCEIYPGKLIYSESEYVTIGTDGKYVEKNAAKLENTIDVSGVAIVTLNGKQIKLIKVPTGGNGAGISEYDYNKGKFVPLKALTDLEHNNYSTSTTGAGINNEGIITVTVAADKYKLGDAIAITSTSK